MQVSAFSVCLVLHLIFVLMLCIVSCWLVHMDASWYVSLQVWCCILQCGLSSFLVHVRWVAVALFQSILGPSQCLARWLQTMDILGWVSDHLYQWGRSIAWFSVVLSAFPDQCNYGYACFCLVFHQCCILAGCMGGIWLVVSTAEHMIPEWNSPWHLSPGALQLHLICG